MGNQIIPTSWSPHVALQTRSLVTHPHVDVTVAVPEPVNRGSVRSQSAPGLQICLHLYSHSGRHRHCSAVPSLPGLTCDQTEAAGRGGDRGEGQGRRRGGAEHGPSPQAAIGSCVTCSGKTAPPVAVGGVRVFPVPHSESAERARGMCARAVTAPAADPPGNDVHTLLQMRTSSRR